MQQDSVDDAGRGAPPSGIDWLGVLRESWLIIAVAIVTGLSGAVLFLHLVQPRYSAYLELVPVERSGTSISRNLSGLASLAGINLASEPTSQFKLALETMKGRDVASVIARDQNMMRRMFPKEWNRDTHQWREPVDPLGDIKTALKHLIAIPVHPWSRPGPAEAQQFVDKHLVANEDKQHGTATAVMSTEDPALARDLLGLVYSATDDHLRNRMDLRTTRYVAYIARKMNEVTLNEHRQALAQALSDQERTLMMVRSGQPFSAEPLGQITVATRPTWPNVPLVLGAGLVLGGGVGTAIGVLRRWRRGRSRVHETVVAV